MSGRIVQISVPPGGVPKTRGTAARVTVEGLEWPAVAPGHHLLLGEGVLLQVTKDTSPCVNIAPAFRNEAYARVSQKRHPGWSRVAARGLATGSISEGDQVRLLTDAEAARTLTPAPT